MADEIKKPYSEPVPQPSTFEAEVFNDPESHRNLVGLFDLLLKIDRRLNARDDGKNVTTKKPPQP